MKPEIIEWLGRRFESVLNLSIQYHVLFRNLWSSL